MDVIKIGETEYQIRDLRLTEYEVSVKISGESLERTLYDEEGEYTSREAKLLDEILFFYVPDDLLTAASDQELEQYIYDHLDWTAL